MKTLAHKIIIYDDVCPLCKAYTEGFVNLGWLVPENRLGFSEAPKEILSHLDLNRARHEIPLYDTETQETIYGKEALFFIIGEEFPIFKPLFKFALFRAFIFVLYQIITYNRRIIAGSKAPKNGFDCAPDFNVFYRCLYIGMVTFGIFFSHQNFLQNIDLEKVVFLNVQFLTIVAGVCISDFQQKITYFGHLATVALIVVLLATILPFVPFIFWHLLAFYLMYRRIK